MDSLLFSSLYGLSAPGDINEIDVIYALTPEHSPGVTEVHDHVLASGRLPLAAPEQAEILSYFYGARLVF